MTANTVNQNDIMDFDLDALEDLPEFLVAPAGAYLLEGISLSQLQDEKRGTTVVAKFKVLATEELKNPETDKPVPDGHTLEYQYPLQLLASDGTVNERGTAFCQGALKAVTKPLAQYLGVNSFSALSEKFPGLQVGAILTARKYKDRDGEDRTQSNIKSIVIG